MLELSIHYIPVGSKKYQTMNNSVHGRYCFDNKVYLRQRYLVNFYREYAFTWKHCQYFGQGYDTHTDKYFATLLDPYLFIYKYC